MGVLAYFVVAVIIVIGVVGFLVFSANDESLTDLKQSEFISSKSDPILLHSESSLNLDEITSLNPGIETHPSLKILDTSDITLDESSIYQNPQSGIKSLITDEIIEANKLYEEKKYQEALLLYEQVLSSDPTNMYALNGKGGSLLDLKQFDASIATFDTSLKYHPDNINALNGKAYAFYLKAFPFSLPGLFYDSIHTYQKSLLIDPKNMNALIGIASAYAALERYDEAIHYYNRALSVDPKHENANNALFSLWIKLGTNEVKFFYFESAIAYFDKVLQVDPTNLSALLSKANAYTEWGKTKEKHYVTAENMYNSILDVHPNNPQALVGMGYVLTEQLKFEEAFSFYERALEIDPDHLNAQRGKSLAQRHILYGG